MRSLRSILCSARRSAASAALLAALSASPFAAAQVSPHGSEFQVNTYTTGSQVLGALTAAPSGDFVVVWQSDGSYGTDTSGTSIQLQRFSANGTPLGGELQVNSATESNQGHPSLASDAQGNFIVVWESGDYDSGWGWRVRAQRFDSESTPIGSELAISSHLQDWARFPSVATDPSGNFVVVWECYPSVMNGFDICAKRFTATGVSRGPEFLVNDLTASDQRFPAVATDAEGGFVVAWDGISSWGTDPDSSVQARRFDSEGNPLGKALQVNTYSTGVQAAAAVAAAPDGRFVVAWSSAGSNGTDQSSFSVQARRYDAGGNPLGSDFQVNDFTTNAQFLPTLAMDRGGEFLVEWTSGGSTGTDHSGRSVQARRYLADGTPREAEFQVNTFTPLDQMSGAAVIDGAGNFVLAWVSQGSSGTDRQFESIHGQRYDGLFRDGFETGDTGRWSASVP